MLTNQARIEELEKEIQRLESLRDEAREEYTKHDDDASYHAKKSKDAWKRMKEHLDEIEYRKAAIFAIQEAENGQIQSGIA